jgi:hypothetical protein
VRAESAGNGVGLIFEQKGNGEFGEISTGIVRAEREGIGMGLMFEQKGTKGTKGSARFQVE